MKNTELLNKTIATNEKVVLTYKDAEEEYTVTLNDSPKIQLSEIKQQSNNTDNIVAKGILPQTGLSLVLGIAVIAIIAISIIIYIKVKSYNDIK